MQKRTAARQGYVRERTGLFGDGSGCGIGGRRVLAEDHGNGLDLHRRNIHRRGGRGREGEAGCRSSRGRRSGGNLLGDRTGALGRKNHIDRRIGDDTEGERSADAAERNESTRTNFIVESTLPSK